MLVRFRLLDTRWGSLYVHHFLRSDSDRDLHDHPWNFTSLILWGGYFEELFTGQEFPVVGRFSTRYKWRGVGRIVRHQATDAHRVLIPWYHTAWTLIWVSPKIRDWGFHTFDGWVPWQEYIERRVS